MMNEKTPGVWMEHPDNNNHRRWDVRAGLSEDLAANVVFLDILERRRSTLRFFNLILDYSPSLGQSLVNA